MAPGANSNLPTESRNARDLGKSSCDGGHAAIRIIVPLKWIEYGAVYGDLVIIYPKPYSIYLRGTIKV